MARPQMVTRTFVTTKAKILAVDVPTEKTSIVELTLPRQYKNNAEVLKMAQKTCNNPDVRYVHVISTENVETLYGMSEADFIAHAEILPPRSKNEEPETDNT